MQNFVPAQIGLNHETELLIKQSREGACGVDLPEVKNFKSKTGQKSREKIVVYHKLMILAFTELSSEEEIKNLAKEFGNILG